MRQESVTLKTLAVVLHEHCKEKYGVPLVQKISETEFIKMVNSMIVAGEVL